MNINEPSRLLNNLKYDPTSGELFYLSDTGIVRTDKINNTLGYRMIAIDNKMYYSHRLIWELVHGKPPKGQIDHINRDRFDNRLNNLRDVSRYQNNQNVGKQTKATSRFKGVSWNTRTQSWVAEIRFHGKRKQLGYFKDERFAALAYNFAAQEYHGEFAVYNLIGEGHEGTTSITEVGATSSPDSTS